MTVFTARAAIRTMATLVRVKLIDGVLNLLYSGRLLNRNSFTGRKFLPHDMMMVSRVTMIIHHLSGPFTTMHPKRKRNAMMAPK